MLLKYVVAQNSEKNLINIYYLSVETSLAFPQEWVVIHGIKSSNA